MQTKQIQKVDHSRGQGELISLTSRWVGESQVRIRVRHINSKGKLKIVMVDLFELSPEGHEVERTVLNHLAIEAAMVNGAGSHDFCVIRDYLTFRKANRLDGTVTYTNIREKSFVFRSAE